MAVAGEGLGLAIAGQTLLAPTDVALGRGAALSVTGPNGSGKTTLLRLVAGLERPSAGRVAVLGWVPDLRNGAFRAATARLVAPLPFSFRLTMLEHLVLVGLTWGYAGGEARSRAWAILEALMMTDTAPQYPHELSTGQAQCLALAATLIRPFDVAFVDEPERALDQERLGAVGALLADRVKAGAALLVATHARSLVAALGGAELRLGS